MTMLHWGRGLALWGAVAALCALTPALVLGLLPAEYGAGFFGLLAVMLALSVAPLAAVIASVGVILLLVALLRGAGRG
jgi:hypothetical protein